MLRILSAMAVFYLIPAGVFAQGVRMSADFLPLEVGNRWIYTVHSESGEKIGQLDVQVQERTILGGRSFYIFNQFPFVTRADGARSTLVRYDRQAGHYLWLDGSEEVVLFRNEEAAIEVLESAGSGLPAKFRLDTGSFALVFERGVGIVEAKAESDRGAQILQLVGARVGERTIGEGIPPVPVTREEKAKELIDNVAAITEQNPRLEVQAELTTEGHRLILIVKNTSNKLLPFDFNSGQSFDFVVSDPTTGQEVWRWSRRMFFTAVLRSEAVRPGKEWRFDAIWNHLDNDLNPVQPGKYRVVGILTSRPPLQSEPAPLEWTR